MRPLHLPSWAELISRGRVKIHASKMYPEMLERLGCDEKDQYWLSMALECAKLEVRHALVGTDALPGLNGALVLIVSDTDKSSGLWVLANYPKGKLESLQSGASYAAEVKAAFKRINPGAL